MTDLWEKTACSIPHSPHAALIFRLRATFIRSAALLCLMPGTLTRREYCLKKLSIRHVRTLRAHSSRHFSRRIFSHSPSATPTSRYSRRQRLKRGPVTFRLKAQLAAAGDSTKDPRIPWPNDRKVVELGVLTINKAVPNSAEVEKKLLFLPGQLTDGIEESDDPLIDVRNGAYALSFSRRNP